MEQESALSKLRQEMEDLLHRADREREELQEELRSLQHDRDQSLLQAETEKQQVRSQPPKKPYTDSKPSRQTTPAQVFHFYEFFRRSFPSPQALSLKETEKAVLSDRVSYLQTELSAAALEAERMSREAALYKEQEQVMPLGDCVKTCSPGVCFGVFTSVLCVLPQFRVAALSGELQALRSQLEDAASLHEREVGSAREACAELQSHADVALKEVRMPFKSQ